LRATANTTITATVTKTNQIGKGIIKILLTATQGCFKWPYTLEIRADGVRYRPDQLDWCCHITWWLIFAGKNARPSASPALSLGMSRCLRRRKHQDRSQWDFHATGF